MKHVALYARVSTNQQSTDMQLADLRKYAEQRGLVVVHEWVDEGISGAKHSRPALNALMAAARKRRFDAVLVWRFDRWARSTKHLVDSLLEFKSLGIEFISFQENIDTSSPMGQAMFSIIAAMGQLERDLIISRVRAGVSAARAKGTKFGRPKQRDDAAIRQLRDSGLSYREIGEQLQIGQGTVRAALSMSPSVQAGDPTHKP